MIDRFTTSEAANLAIQRFDGYSLGKDGHSLTVRLRARRDSNVKRQLSNCRDFSLNSSSELPTSGEKLERPDHRRPLEDRSNGATLHQVSPSQIPLNGQFSCDQKFQNESGGIVASKPSKNAALVITKKQSPILNSVGDWVDSQSKTTPERKKKSNNKFTRSHSGTPKVNSDQSTKLKYVPLAIPPPERFANCSGSDSDSPSTKKLDGTPSLSELSTLVGSGSESGAPATDGVLLSRKGSLCRHPSGSSEKLEPIIELQNTAEIATTTSDVKNTTDSPTASEEAALNPAPGIEGSPAKVEFSTTNCPVTTPKKNKSKKSKKMKAQRHGKKTGSTGEISDLDLSPEPEVARHSSKPQEIESINANSGALATLHHDISKFESSPEAASKAGSYSKTVMKHSCSVTASHMEHTSDPKSQSESHSTESIGATALLATHHNPTKDCTVNPPSAPIKMPADSSTTSRKTTKAAGAVPLTSEHKPKKPATPKHQKSTSDSSLGSPTRKLGSSEMQSRGNRKNNSFGDHSPSPASKIHDKQKVAANHKENKAFTSPIDVLSDMSQWPALGTTRSSANINSKIQAQALNQIPAKSRSPLSRRESLASVKPSVESSQQQVWYVASA